jgi:RNA polymerase sporulation-specific sigma factor
VTKQRLIEENMNLVYSIVSKEYPTYIHDEDIIQSGMLGLCKAAENWDERKSKFSTYAWRCIRNEINNEFISRKPHSQNISLETRIGEDGTLGDILPGDDDVGYVDDETFCDQLTEEELRVFCANRLGLTTEEVADRYGWSMQKVQKLSRLIRIKWKRFFEERQ